MLTRGNYMFEWHVLLLIDNCSSNHSHFSVNKAVLDNVNLTSLFICKLFIIIHSLTTKRTLYSCF